MWTDECSRTVEWHAFQGQPRHVETLRGHAPFGCTLSKFSSSKFKHSLTSSDMVLLVSRSSILLPLHSHPCPSEPRSHCKRCVRYTTQIKSIAFSMSSHQQKEIVPVLENLWNAMRCTVKIPETTQSLCDMPVLGDNAILEHRFSNIRKVGAYPSYFLPSHIRRMNTRHTV